MGVRLAVSEEHGVGNGEHDGLNWDLGVRNGEHEVPSAGHGGRNGEHDVPSGEHNVENGGHGGVDGGHGVGRAPGPRRAQFVVARVKGSTAGAPAVRNSRAARVSVQPVSL